MRLATWNVNSVKARLPRLLDWLADKEPDIVCLQETKCPADGFPAREVAALGYATAAHGDGRWNGVAVLSRIGLEDVSPGFPGEPGFDSAKGTVTVTPEPRAVGATCGGLRVWSIYAPNGRTLDSPHYTYKLAWFAAFGEAVRAELRAGRAV
ncbi:exodeoxyribonuclease III, partial [Nonomuraea ferruginea]